MKGLKFFEEKKRVDTLIIGRGGGSQEDLFCFNSEELARAIFAAKTPIIAGIGHEIDFTIADFVADLRAPTPSAAAELAVPDKQELLEKLQDAQTLLKFQTQAKFSHFKQKIELQHQTLLALSPFSRLKELKSKVEKSGLRMNYLLASAFHKISENFKISQGKLAELSPLKTLSRGYTIARQGEKTLRSVKSIHENKILELIFPDGYAQIEIKKIEKKKL